MRLLAVFLHCFLVACTSTNVRLLGEDERIRLGLTGIAYDLPLCPTSYDANAKTSKVTGPCELVTCLMENQKVVCRAVPKKN